MNHNSGLKYGIDALGVSPAEVEAIEAFRQAHNGRGKSTSDPTFMVPSDQLPGSGWRSLDDQTLLRFLRADKRGDKVNLSASEARLTAALLWRKQVGADSIIANPPAGPALASLNPAPFVNASQVREWPSG